MPKCSAGASAPTNTRASAVGAVLVNQKTCGAVLGWTRKRFIKFVTTKGVPFARDGRLYNARVDDVLGALGLAEAQATKDTAFAWSPDDVLAGIRGCR